MALGERFRGSGSSGVAQFLAEHQDCDAGFDVTRDKGPGSGQLSIACKGCGASVEYKAAEAAEMASGPPLENGHSPPDPSEATAAAAAPSASPAPSPRPGTRTRGPVRPRRLSRAPLWLPNAFIAALILAGIGLIVVGLLSSSDGEESGTESNVSDDASEQQRPAEGEQPQEPAVTPEPEPRAQTPFLERRAFIGRFAIGVPRGWRTAAPGGNVVLTAPGGVAQIRVYSDSPARDPQQLARPTADFLRQEHPGAQISKPRRVRFGGEQGLLLLASYDGGEEAACVISASGFSFLVTYARKRSASADVAREGEAAYESFRPR